MKRRASGSDVYEYGLRLPESLATALKATAAHNKRSLNTEIALRLNATLGAGSMAEFSTPNFTVSQESAAEALRSLYADAINGQVQGFLMIALRTRGVDYILSGEASEPAKARYLARLLPQLARELLKAATEQAKRERRES